MADKVYFTKTWYDEILKADEFEDASPQEMAYILYAAAQYSFNGEKTNFGDTFGSDFKGLNKVMTGYYGQIDRMIGTGSEQAKRNNKYDNDAIERLAAQGLTQKAICRELGYSEENSKSLSSNPGYKRGRQSWKDGKELSKTGIAVDSSSKNCQEIAIKKNFDF